MAETLISGQHDHLTMLEGIEANATKRQERGGVGAQDPNPVWALEVSAP
jgi:hypothetical protein